MSILDYQKNSLSSDIWINNAIKPGVKKYIISALKVFFDFNDIKGYHKFVKDVFIGSSLATYLYKDNTDLDIKIIVDLETFRKDNFRFDWLDNEDMLDYLTKEGRKDRVMSSFVPGTAHQLDFYFIATDEHDLDSLIKYDSLYDLKNEVWIKEPHKITNSVSYSILEKAKEKASFFIQKLDLDLAKAKRDTIDFIILRDYMKSLDSNELKEIESEFNTLLESINESVELLINDREIIKFLRKKEFSKKELSNDLERIMGSLNFSDGNIIYKLIQRYGYMRILSEIKELFKNKNISSDKDVSNLIEILDNN
jgi:hypothetical protein